MHYRVYLYQENFISSKHMHKYMYILYFSNFKGPVFSWVCAKLRVTQTPNLKTMTPRLLLSASSSLLISLKWWHFIGTTDPSSSVSSGHLLPISLIPNRGETRIPTSWYKLSEWVSPFLLKYQVQCHQGLTVISKVLTRSYLKSSHCLSLEMHL